MRMTYCFLDIETTGLDPRRDLMLEISWLFTDSRFNVTYMPRTFLVEQDDWQATWRNWIRNANDYTQRRRGNYGKPNTDHNGTYETTEQLIAGLGINARIIT